MAKPLCHSSGTWWTKVLLSLQNKWERHVILFLSMGRAHNGGFFGSQWIFFFFYLFSLVSWKDAPKLLKKQLYNLVCILIDFDPPFNYYLFSFWCFLKINFISILSLGIFLIWFSYPILLIPLFMYFIFFLFFF